MCICLLNNFRKFFKHVEKELEPDDIQKRLYFAIYNSDWKSLDVLLASEMEVNFKDVQGNTLLHLVCDSRDNHRDCLRLVKSLVKYGVDPNVKNNQKVTCLMQAVARGKTDVCQFLITRCGVDLNAKDCLGSTALSQAVRRELLEEVKLLLDSEADANSEDDCGDTPLHHAVRSKNKAILNLLLEAKADPNKRNGKGMTPLHLAMQPTQNNKNLKWVMSRLIEEGADVNIPEQSGTTLLMKAASRGDVILCQFLVQNGSCVNAVDAANFTALHHAIARTNSETVKYLVNDCRADARIRNLEGDDCLRYAAVNCPEDTAILNCLTEFGSTIDLIEECELRACHFVMARNEKKAFRLWATACELRENPEQPFPKLDRASDALRETEFRNKMELECVFVEEETAGPVMQALLVYERILGHAHAQTLFAFRHVLRERRSQISSDQLLIICEQLLERTVSRYGLRNRQTFNSLEAIVFYLLQSLETGKGNLPSLWEPLHRMQRIIKEKLKSQIQISRPHGLTNQLSTPVDAVANHLLTFISISAGIGCSDTQLKQSKELVREILSYHPMNASGDHLLHLAVSGREMTDERLNFAQRPTVELLLRCGASVNRVNNRGATPLHIAAVNDDLDDDVLKVMIGLCDHTDSCDADRRRIATLLARRTKPIVLNNLERLQCLAAQTIMNNRVPYDHPGVPIIIRHLISIH